MTETSRPEELLTRVGLFAALGRVELAKLAAYLDPVELAAGSEVFRQGDTGDSLYVVAAGRWASSWPSTERPEHAPRGHAHARRSVRRDGALHRQPRSATVRADGSTQHLAIAARALSGSGGREPTISLTIAATLSLRLRSANAARVEHASFVASAIETALRQLPDERRAAGARGQPARPTARPRRCRRRSASQAEAVAADLRRVGRRRQRGDHRARACCANDSSASSAARAWPPGPRRSPRGWRRSASGTTRSACWRGHRRRPCSAPGAGAGPARGPRARHRARAALDRARGGRAGRSPTAIWPWPARPCTNRAAMRARARCPAPGPRRRARGR